MTDPATLVFLEFPDEVDTYLKAHHSSDVWPASTIVVSLSPRTHAYLRHLGHTPETSLPYFGDDSHANALRKSNEVCEWVWRRIEFRDNWGVGFAYLQSLVWYTRLIVHHFLWILEILDNATARHGAQVIQACASPVLDPAGHVIGPNERYLGILTEAFGRARGLRVELIGSPGAGRLGRSRLEVVRSVQRLLAARILAPLVTPAYRSHLRRIGARRPVLFTAQEYRMIEVAGLLAREKRGLSIALMREWGSRPGLAGLFGSNGGSPYDVEAWLGLLEPVAPEDQRSRRALQARLKRLATEIDGAPDVFSYRGVPFASLVRRKLAQGIGPFVVGLHRRAATLRLLLDTLRPSAVLSAGNRDDDMIMGELCRREGIPAMMIEHGSHVPPRNELERIEWGAQAQRLLLAPFPYVALQSPLAESFLKAFPSTSEGVRTGPVVWGSPVDRQRSALLRRRRLQGSSSGRVIVHANTPKGRGSNRFHVYETPDEYVQSLRDLAAAVEGLTDVHLVVKFRPSLDLNVEDLRALVPFSERVTLSVEESFLDVLGFADLLVSFSSTTIEEALQNRVPVLLYGGHGRYQHVPGVEVTPEGPCPRAAVYVVRRPEHLGTGLRRILDTHTPGDAREELFAPYCFREGTRIRLVDWLASNASLTLTDAATV